MKVQKFKSTWNLSFLAMYEFVINSDRKTISQRLLYILYLVWGRYTTIFKLNKGFKHLNLVESFYSAWIALSNPQKNWTLIFQVRWTNLKPPVPVDFPYLIHILVKVYITCLNRIRWINWIYFVFVQVTYNRSAHFHDKSQFFLGDLNFVCSLQPDFEVWLNHGG